MLLELIKDEIARNYSTPLSGIQGSYILHCSTLFRARLLEEVLGSLQVIGETQTGEKVPYGISRLTLPFVGSIEIQCDLVNGYRIDEEV